MRPQKPSGSRDRLGVGLLVVVLAEAGLRGERGRHFVQLLVHRQTPLLLRWRAPGGVPRRSVERGAHARRVLREDLRVRHVARVEAQVEALVARHDVEMEVEHGLPGRTAVQLRDQDARRVEGALAPRARRAAWSGSSRRARPATRRTGSRPAARGMTSVWPVDLRHHVHERERVLVLEHLVRRESRRAGCARRRCRCRRPWWWSSAGARPSSWREYSGGAAASRRTFDQRMRPRRPTGRRPTPPVRSGWPRRRPATRSGGSA